MLPGYGVSALSGLIGSEISLCTMEYYEGSLGGGNLIPRLVGFLSPTEREFFTTFISVKGLGIRKGLRALNIPIQDIAAAIENGDEKLLMSLPGIGRRMAQQTVAELKGKLQTFAVGAEPTRVATQFKAFQVEALEVLVAWGEKRNEAMELIELAAQKHPGVRTAEELVPLVYRLKQGVEV
jgi:Holliday junction DNA helicase RuvA